MSKPDQTERDERAAAMDKLLRLQKQYQDLRKPPPRLRPKERPVRHQVNGRQH